MSVLSCLATLSVAEDSTACSPMLTDDPDMASPRHMMGLYSVANPIWCDSAEMGLVTSHTNQDLS